MSRIVYRGLLWLHPRFFRDRFAGEMLWIFDETVGAQGAAALLADGLWSLLRQWLVRRITWKVAAAVLGALLQVGLVAALTASHAARMASRRSVTAGGSTAEERSTISPAGRVTPVATIDPATPAGDKALPFVVLFGVVFVYAALRRRMGLGFPRRLTRDRYRSYKARAQLQAASKGLSIVAD